MLFKSIKQKNNTPFIMEEPARKNFLIWLEIGATNIYRAADFYHKVFGVHIEIQYLFDKKIGVFKKENSNIGLCLIERETPLITGSVKPTFYVNIIHDTIEKIILNKGLVITHPTLLKQYNTKGETLIGSNLIDDQIGYMAEFTDTEGNPILLYSHC